jgi:hypothetical protein
MAHSLVIEEESGTSRGWVHPHNGYYAGDFSSTHQMVSEHGAAALRHLHAVVDQQVETRNSATPPVTGWPEAA